MTPLKACGPDCRYAEGNIAGKSHRLTLRLSSDDRETASYYKSSRYQNSKKAKADFHKHSRALLTPQIEVPCQSYLLIRTALSLVCHFKMIHLPFHQYDRPTL